MDLGSLKQTVRKYYKESWGEPYATTTPQFGTQNNATNGILGMKMITCPNTYSMTNSATVTISRGQVVTFDCGEGCKQITAIGYIGVVSPNNWPGMRMNTLQCSEDNMYWTDIRSSYGGRGDYLTTPLQIPTPNNYRYFRFTTWVDDGGYSVGGCHDMKIFFDKRDKIVEESTRSNYDYYIDYELPKASYIDDTTETHYYKKAESLNCLLTNSPTLNNFELSGFSTTSYGRIPITIDTSKTWEIMLKMKTGTDVSSTQNLITFTTSDCRGFLSYLTSGGYRIYASNNKSSWNIVNGTVMFTATASTIYYMKYSWDGTNFNVEYSTDGENFTLGFTSTTEPLFLSDIFLGFRNAYTGEWWRGSIFLKDSYIKVNDEYVWRGTSEYITETTSDDPDIYETKTITKTNVKHIDRSY